MMDKILEKVDVIAGLTTKALIPFLKPWAGDLALVNSLSMGIMAIYIIIAFGAEYAEIKGINKMIFLKNAKKNAFFPQPNAL